MRLLAAALTVLALTTAGCGSGDDPVDPDAASTSESPTSQTPSEAPATDDSEEPTVAPTSADPCALVTDADVKESFGIDVGPGEPSRGQHDENGVEFTSTGCEWEADDALELSFALSTAEDFGGTLACTPVSYLGDEGAPVKVAGADSATWLASEDPDEIEARLRVCTTDLTINFELDAAASGAGMETLRKQTTALAAKAVAALG